MCVGGGGRGCIKKRVKMAGKNFEINDGSVFKYTRKCFGKILK